MGTSDDLWLSENTLRYSPDVYCAIDPAGRFRRVSGACRQVLGYESDEMVGRRFTDIVHSNDRAAVEKCPRAAASWAGGLRKPLPGQGRAAGDHRVVGVSAAGR